MQNSKCKIVESASLTNLKISVGDTIILPLVDVSFGVAAGAFSETGKGTKDNGAGGMGGKIQPSSILVIKDGQIAKHGAKDEILPQLLGTTSAVDMCSKFNQGGVQ